MLLLTCVLVAAGCDVPKDPGGTLRRVAGASVRVGVSDNPPWIIYGGDGVRGVEAGLVAEMAGELGSRIEWVPGAESVVLEKLERREVDLVAAGICDDTPWKDDVALTRPYFVQSGRACRNHVLAAPPGENAWLLRLDAMLAAREADVSHLVADATGSEPAR